MTAAVLALIALGAPTPATGPVAVFSEPAFPYYIASQSVTPEFVASRLTGVGIGCSEVDAAQLADPGAFNAQRYRVLAWVYGNTFPLAALANLRQFHSDGGSIVAFGGVPFCHPCEREGGRWVDRIDGLGWEFVSHRQLGMGLWDQASQVEAVRWAEDDPLGLSWMPLPPASPGPVQFPRLGVTLEDSKALGYEYPLGLPGEDVLRPLVSVWKDGQAVGSPVCAIEHHCPEFRGATDLWVGATLSPSFTMQQQEQLTVACCAYALEAQGALAPERRRAILEETRANYVWPTTEELPADTSYLPRATQPARTLYVLDAATLSPDEQMLALSLQGIVNRTEPRIYVLTQFADETWLAQLLAEGRERVDVASLGDLVAEFGGEVRGAIVYDPAEPAALNVATTLSGVRDAVAATADLAAKHGLRVVEDTRGRCTDAAVAYERLVAEHWDALDHTAVACLSPRAIAPRDYLIQHRILTFWLEAERQFQVPSEQLLFFERLLCRMPAHATVHGWWQEGDEGGIGEARGVYVSSQYAKTTICTAGAYNVSVLSGEPIPEGLTNRPIAYGSLDRKVYLSFLVSDGDNFGMNLSSCIEARWGDAMRGRVPVGWALCPTQLELTPGAVERWYRTATDNDYFLAMDGLGYVYPDIYGDALGDGKGQYAEFLRRTRPFMRSLDMHHLWYLGGTSKVSTMVETLDLDGLFGEYAVTPDRGPQSLRGTIAFRSDLNPWEKPWDDVGVLVDRIRQRTPAERPAFLFCGVNGFTTGPNAIARILEELGPDYVAVRPDELCDLARRYLGEGVDAAPAPRPALDLVPPPTIGTQTLPDGTLLVRDDDGQPEISGWYTDPQGTQWVRKRLNVPLPAGAARATVSLYVRGESGKHLILSMNGHEHTIELRSSAWGWVSLDVPVAELIDGENDLRYSGNPEGRLLIAGDASTLAGHSDFGSPGGWSPLMGELLCYLEIR